MISSWEAEIARRDRVTNERDVQAVAEDVRLGRYSVAQARTEFGVVLTPELRVDVERTDIYRAERSST